MNEEQLEKLKQNEKINLEEASGEKGGDNNNEENSWEKESLIQKEIELAEYTLFGLALGFIVVVCLFYLLNHYNIKQEMIEEVQKQIEEARKK